MKRRRRLSRPLLAALAVNGLLAFAANAQAASVTITGPPNGASQYWLDPPFTATATADTSGCGPGFVWVYIWVHKVGSTLSAPAGSSLNEGTDTEELPSSPGTYEYWGQMTCPSPAHDGTVLDPETAHYTYTMTEKRPAPPRKPKKPKPTAAQQKALMAEAKQQAKRTLKVVSGTRQAAKNYRKAPTKSKFQEELEAWAGKAKQLLDELKALKEKWELKGMPTSVGQAGGQIRKAQALALIPFVQSGNELLQQRPAAVKKLDAMYNGLDSSARGQLDVYANVLAKNPSGGGWEALTPEQKLDLAVGRDLLVGSGAWKPIVNGAADAGIKASTVNFAAP